MSGTCSIDGCVRPRKYASTGWCQTHYHRNYRTGTVELRPRPISGKVGYRAAHARVAANCHECRTCRAARARARQNNRKDITP
jgi:hypothetical protein